MGHGDYWGHRFLILAMLLSFAAAPGRAVARQNSGEQPAAEPPPSNPNPEAAGASPDASQAAPPSGEEPKEDPAKDPAKAPAKDHANDNAAQAAKPSSPRSEDSGKETTQHQPSMQAYALSSSYSVELPSDWVANTKSEIPPPAPLSPYAPPFHLAGNLVLLNPQRGAILQFATSDNPFIGHDAYWLDTQMHSPSGSGMSLLDFFFYYFFPPSDACMHEVLTSYAPASRVSAETDSPAYMQVYYSCPRSDTLSGFYSAQVSSGITFQLTENGTRVLAPVGDFYVAPMEQIEESGMTFFVFEAQGMNEVSSDAAARFHLPANSQGGAPDFFWAIAATSPFPFVAGATGKDVAILHVAYARLGVDADAKSEFMNILREIRTH